MLHTLTLGKRNFPVNIIQGPLAGISCAPFRELAWRYSRPAFSCTEMISCKTFLFAPLKQQQRFIQKDPQEGPVCFQLASNNPAELADAVKKATDLGADIIDLNCGCPVRKIRKKGEGSRLLTDVPALYQLISAMKKHTPVPVSIKIRVESAEEKFNQAVATAVSDAGADFLVVHGRHWTQHYETPCRYADIQFFVEALKIPVIGNGDVADVASLQRLFATGCAGVMIGRAGVGQPWLIAKLVAEMQGKPFALPSNQEIGQVFLEHVHRLAVLLGSEKWAVLQARQFAKYYARHLPSRADFVLAMNRCTELSALERLCQEFFGQEG